MSIEQWWPKLTPSTQALLIDTNGDVVPPEVIEEITDAGGTLEPGSPWFGERGPDGVTLSDAAIDWIEAAGNDESPDAPA